MRIAILADIHANLEALTAVLNDIAKRGVQKIWCLGDVIDYGPDPRACISVLRQQKFVSVAGNHDLAALGVLDTADFHPDASAANSWTRDQLQQADMDFLAVFPAVLEEGQFTLVHGTPRNHVWEYLTTIEAAADNLRYFNTPVCLFGHTHRPVVYRCGDDGKCVLEAFTEDAEVALVNQRLLINPGAVGQPRDGDPRASYAVYDTESKSLRLVRVPYDIAATQAKMLKAKLPQALVARLSYGL